MGFIFTVLCWNLSIMLQANMVLCAIYEDKHIDQVLKEIKFHLKPALDEANDVLHPVFEGNVYGYGDTLVDIFQNSNNSSQWKVVNREKKALDQLAWQQ